MAEISIYGTIGKPHHVMVQGCTAVKWVCENVICDNPVSFDVEPEFIENLVTKMLRAGFEVYINGFSVLINSDNEIVQPLPKGLT